jgi:hypothetical protein
MRGKAGLVVSNAPDVMLYRNAVLGHDKGLGPRGSSGLPCPDES